MSTSEVFAADITLKQAFFMVNVGSTPGFFRFVQPDLDREQVRYAGVVYSAYVAPLQGADNAQEQVWRIWTQQTLIVPPVFNSSRVLIYYPKFIPIFVQLFRTS